MTRSNFEGKTREACEAWARANGYRQNSRGLWRDATNRFGCSIADDGAVWTATVFHLA